MHSKTAYVTYFRVSTARQGQSGLGLAAQKEAVDRLLNPGDSVVASFTEVESGKNSARPQLHAAIERCRALGATLLIAKLDRLGRRMSFLSALMDSDVPFICCDNPHATRFTLHILGAVAEHEADMISQRTKAALRAAKARGIKLGGWRGGPVLSDEARAKGVALGNARKTAKAKARAVSLAPQIAELQAKGATSLRALADGLNALSIPAPKGGAWQATTVSRVLTTLSA